MTRPPRFIAGLAAACIGFAGFIHSAQAGGLITTEQVAAAEGLRSAAAQRADLLSMLKRDDVSAALAERGVTPDQARARVAALTDVEVARIAAEIDTSPAGAGELIGTVVIVLVVLLFTDILGYTHVFPFVKPAR